MLKSNKSPDADQGSLWGGCGSVLNMYSIIPQQTTFGVYIGDWKTQSCCVFTTTLLLLMAVLIGPWVSHDTSFAYPFVPAMPAQRGCLKGCSAAFSSVTHFRWDMRHAQEVCRKDFVLSCLLFPTSYCFLRQTYQNPRDFLFEQSFLN